MPDRVRVGVVRLGLLVLVLFWRERRESRQLLGVSAAAGIFGALLSLVLPVRTFIDCRRVIQSAGEAAQAVFNFLDSDVAQVALGIVLSRRLRPAPQMRALRPLVDEAMERRERRSP